MYSQAIKDNIISNLENKVINIVNNSIFLASQGYLVDKAKSIKLDWSSILLHAFENIDILKNEQKSSIERIYNKISAL